MLIGLGSTAQVGKDTSADYLVKNHEFTKVSFATTLKEACRSIFGLTDEQLYGNLKEVIDEYWNVTPRFILQKVGTECMRNVYDRDIWIKSLGKKILSNKNKNWVIADVRFMNEVEAIKNWNGILINVKRINSGTKSGIKGHESENSLDKYNKWDYTIHNDGSFEELYKKLDNLMELLRS